MIAAAEIDEDDVVTQTPDGLDLAALRALQPARYDRNLLLDRIAEHLEQSDGYIAFSGGKDSTAVLHLAVEVEPNIPVVFFNSGAEYPETYEFVEQIADQWKLNLEVIASSPPLLEVLAAGGSWDHTSSAVAAGEKSLHDILITQPAATAHSRHGPGELWGVRADESAKGTGRWSLYHRALADELARGCDGCCSTRIEQRRRHGGVIRRADGTRVFGPIWDWSSSEVWSYIARHNLPANPVYDKLRALGVPDSHLRVSHIIDGNFLERGRITWLRRGWPALFEELAAVLPRLREFV